MGKRAFDVVFGAVLALVALPLILGFAIALAITLRAWPFFLQERVGQHGRHFRIVKLRTLPPHAPRYALKNSLDFTALPAVARFLRRTHLDELPQLFCVLSGHLSLVGPRPKMPDAHEPVDQAYAAVRQSVRQGCTGLWQIGRAADGLPHEAPEYDFFYVENQSLALDIWILVQTVQVIFGLSRGASLEAVPKWALAGSRPVLPQLAQARVMAFDSNQMLSQAEAA
ncbi:MAG TPA: sugar transferase [Acidimicrobiales bacterium]|nr:sugar transferase [Acidimicrobiales bacterium]